MPIEISFAARGSGPPEDLFSQVIYCRGYSGEEPPLPIPNREVKLTRDDGTDLPVGRVIRRGFSRALTSHDAGALFFERL